MTATTPGSTLAGVAVGVVTVLTIRPSGNSFSRKEMWFSLAAASWPSLSKVRTVRKTCATRNRGLPWHQTEGDLRAIRPLIRKRRANTRSTYYGPISLPMRQGTWKRPRTRWGPLQPRETSGRSNSDTEFVEERGKDDGVVQSLDGKTPAQSTLVEPVTFNAHRLSEKSRSPTRLPPEAGPTDGSRMGQFSARSRLVSITVREADLNIAYARIGNRIRASSTGLHS